MGSFLCDAPPPSLFYGSIDMQFLRGTSELAKLLRISNEYLDVLLQLTSSQRYTSFMIPKRRGGTRKIESPTKDLKKIQGKLAYAIALLGRPSEIATAYVPGKSIYDHAHPHQASEWVLTFDLESFFTSIKSNRLHDLLMNTGHLDAEAACAIVNLCTLEGHLPQGAPTSPILSNLALAKFDQELVQLCSDHSCVVTRYADDICISSRDAQPPEALVYLHGRPCIGKTLNELVESHDLKVNNRKTHFSRKPSPHLITGLVVTDKIRVPKKFKRQLRVLRHLHKTLGDERADIALEDWGPSSFRGGTPASIRAMIDGKQAFLDYIDRRNANCQ